MEEVQLPIRNNKGYENIEVQSGPSRRRRFAFFLAAVGLVLTIVAVGVNGSKGKSLGESSSSPSAPSATATSATGEVTTQACGLTAGSSSFRTLNIDGITRSYKIVVPAAPTFPASLIVAFHGVASDVDKIEGKMKLQQSSAASTSILVYPEAKNKGGGLLDPPSFNGASCCKDSTSFKDEEFFAAITNELTSTGCVNKNKIYVMGFSNGGFMTNRVACAPATRDFVTAACVHSGLNGDYNGNLANSPWMNCQAKPVLSIHGTKDNTVPIGGGKSLIGSGQWFSQDEITAMWATGCGNPTKHVLGSKTTSRQVCLAHSVASIKHEGFGHDWHADSTSDCLAWFQEHGGL